MVLATARSWILGLRQVLPQSRSDLALKGFAGHAPPPLSSLALSVPPWTTKERSAHHRTAGPEGPRIQAGEDEDRGLEGCPAAPGRLHPRLHHHSQEAELGVAQGRPCPTHQRHRGDRLYPRHWPQPPGALDRPGAWWSGEGPPRGPLQGHPGHAR